MADSNSFSTIFNFLLKNNLKNTLETFISESKINPYALNSSNDSFDEDFKSLLCLESQINFPQISQSYETFIQCLQNASDSIKCEASLVIFPFFLHLYLNFICQNKYDFASDFFRKFSTIQDSFFENDLYMLSAVTTCDSVHQSHYVNSICENKFTVSMSSESFAFIKKIVESSPNFAILMQILLQNIRVVVHQKSRSKLKVFEDSGSMLGESTSDSNRAKIMYGVRPIDVNIKEDQLKTETNTQSYNKRANDLVCPEINRIPYYQPTEFEHTFLQNTCAERSQMQQLDNKLPSACMYTILNSRNKVNNLTFSQDSSLLACALANSTIKIWSLTFQKLKMYKNPEELHKIDKNSFDIYDKVLTERNCPDNYYLEGHGGPVFGLSFSPYNDHLLSSASDGSIRLWHLRTNSCISVYKGHVGTIWNVKFCPRGYYFSSGGNDGVARIWCVERDSPLRHLVGHYSDIYCSTFHPNSNYLATGSCDRSVRIWDITSGTSARLFCGFKSEIRSLTFSSDGRFLFIGEQRGAVHMYDISDSRRVATFLSHSSAVVSMSISNDHRALATGSLDGSVKLWNMRNSVNKYLDSEYLDSVQYVENPLSTFYTKRSPIYAINFNNRNVLTCCGEFRPK